MTIKLLQRSKPPISNVGRWKVGFGRVPSFTIFPVANVSELITKVICHSWQTLVGLSVEIQLFNTGDYMQRRQTGDAVIQQIWTPNREGGTRKFTLTRKEVNHADIATQFTWKSSQDALDVVDNDDSKQYVATSNSRTKPGIS